VLGVVYDVKRDDVYAAARGEGAWLGPRRLEVSKDPLGSASLIMMTSNLCARKGVLPRFVGRWLAQTDWKIRILGSAAIEAAQVAAGVAHAAITVNGKLWDVAAAAAVVIEAGGVVTDLKGKTIFPFDLKGYAGAKVPFLAATPSAHQVLVREVRDAC
jgi:myo-inositol-1(or 4)-monophosphatase